MGVVVSIIHPNFSKEILVRTHTVLIYLCVLYIYDIYYILAGVNLCRPGVNVAKSRRGVRCRPRGWLCRLRCRRLQGTQRSRRRPAAVGAHAPRRVVARHFDLRSTLSRRPQLGVRFQLDSRVRAEYINGLGLLPSPSELPHPTPSVLHTSALEGWALMWTSGNQSTAIGC